MVATSAPGIFASALRPWGGCFLNFDVLAGHEVDHALGDVGRTVGDALQSVRYPQEVGGSGDGSRVFDHEG